MKNASDNPYFNLAMIRNVEMFFGRSLLLRRFYAALANHQSVSIIGQRRIGKSSYLWCASQPELQTRFLFDFTHHIFVFLDLHDFSSKTRDDFFQHVSKKIMRQYVRMTGLKLYPETNSEDTFGSVLEQIAEQGFFPVLLLDSFDKVTQNPHFGPQFFGFLRSQASRGLVSYVTASIEPLSKVCHRGIEGSPFFNIFSTHTLGTLTLEEAHELIITPSRQAGMLFTESEVALIQDLAGRHPFFIQRVCHALFDEKMQHPHDEINEHEFGQKLYDELYSQFEDIWNVLSETEQQQLCHAIQHKENIQPELSESSLFTQFVQSNHLKGQFNISTYDLEEALDNLTDRKKLGETRLQSMRVVMQQFKRKALPSSTEKGIIIFKVLRDAFDNLRPGDLATRKDSDENWLDYNILHYKYFDYHLTNGQIAGRLGFSERHFYRKRKDAIEKLLNALLESESIATTSV